MYSTGITFLQLVFTPLQSDNGLAAFNKCAQPTEGQTARVHCDHPGHITFDGPRPPIFCVAGGWRRPTTISGRGGCPRRRRAAATGLRALPSWTWTTAQPGTLPAR
jgi:hypothetical protein